MKLLHQKAIAFVHLVKKRFINQPSKFREFANVVSNVTDHNELISKLKTLFQRDPDLFFGINHFLPNNSTAMIDDVDDHPPKKKLCIGNDDSWLPRKSSSVLFDKVRDRCIEKNDGEFLVLIHFSETVLAYYDKRITYSQADKILKNLFKDDPDLFIESNRVISQSVEKPCEKSGLLRKEDKSGQIFEKREVKSGGKSEVMSNGEKENQSDNGVCTLYENTMDVKEFCMFEIDMAFSRLQSTIEKLDKNPDRLEECLTVLDFKCIKKLYDDSDDCLGEAMVETLKSDPVGRLVGRVVVLQRLRQKKLQLEEQKLQLDRIWNEIFQDIKEKRRVCRHIEFLRRTEMASINGFQK